METNVKVFYLLLYSIALRTPLFSNFDQTDDRTMRYISCTDHTRVHEYPPSLDTNTSGSVLCNASAT